MELFGDFVSARDKAPMDTGEDELFMDEETIAYGQAFELYQMEDGAWQKVTPEQLVDYPAIQYSLPSGMDNELSYDLTASYHLIAGERYRFQAEFRYEDGTEHSEPMANWIEFEAKMNLPY